MADCDSLAASNSELVLPATKTKVTKPALPATPTNSACVLAAATDGPNESQTTADTGDDDIVLKGHYGLGNVVIAHNHFGSGHGMSIGSEAQGEPGLTSTDTAASSNSGIGVQDIDTYDITVDGDTRSNGGTPGSDVSGARVKSDSSRGGIVQNVTYHDVCSRDIVNPLIVNPHYERDREPAAHCRSSRASPSRT